MNDVTHYNGAKWLNNTFAFLLFSRRLSPVRSSSVILSCSADAHRNCSLLRVKGADGEHRSCVCVHQTNSSSVSVFHTQP